MKKLINRLILCAVTTIATINGYANPQDQAFVSQNAYGGIGLIQTPTARFSNDGEFAFGISTEDAYNRLYSKVQIFPWLESVLKYTEGTFEAYNVGSKQTWKDKGIDLKFRLMDESSYLPSIALGFIDMGGTGAYSSEYVVASKRLDNFDFHLGLGWGNLGGAAHINNPVNYILNRGGSREGYGGGLGGLISLDRFFVGDKASFFGGIEYYTPIDNLTFKMEYDPSAYRRAIGKNIRFDDPESEIFSIDSRLNYSLNYQYSASPRDKIDFSLGFVRGNTVSANIAVHSNLNYTGPKKFISPKETINKPYLKPYKELTSEWKKYLSDLIIWQMGNVGFVTHKIVFNENEMQVEISQGRFLNPIDAIDLAARILANNSPTNISTITVINIDQGIETYRASMNRDDLVSSVSKGPIQADIVNFESYSPPIDGSQEVFNDYLYPNFFWEIKPHATGTLQHQEKFYFWQLEALIQTQYSIRKGLYLLTDIGIDIVNNYDDYTYHIPDGELYHVRQDRRKYLTQGTTGLRKMMLDYLVDIDSNIKARMSLGYLEWMYGGLGGEILYMPDHKNWAIGADLYWLKQREFDQGFSFKDYQTITGFLTYYQNLPFYNMRMKISAGKFLAKDIGVNIDISRRFSTGARVGGMVSLTDCDPQCVGEGSFNKWIYFELPMDLFFTRSSTRGKAGYAWSPLTKDAGTKVENGSLYNLMVNAHDEIDPIRRKEWSFKKILSGFSTAKKEKL